MYISKILRGILDVPQNISDIIENGEKLCSDLYLSDNLISNEILLYLRCIMSHSKYNDKIYYRNFTNIILKVLLIGIPCFISDSKNKLFHIMIQNVLFNLLQIMHAWSLTENSLYTFHTDKYAYKLALTSNYRSFDEYTAIIDLIKSIQNKHSKLTDDILKCILSIYLSLPKNKIIYNFSFMDMSDIMLERTKLNNCDFTNSNLQNAIMNYADLRKANLNNAILTGASFHQADLRGANLTGAVYTTELDDAILD